MVPYINRMMYGMISSKGKGIIRGAFLVAVIIERKITGYASAPSLFFRSSGVYSTVTEALLSIVRVAVI